MTAARDQSLSIDNLKRIAEALQAYAADNGNYPPAVVKDNTGKPLHLPVALKATQQGVAITFSQPLNKRSAGDYANYAVSRWTFRRTADYGSDDYSIRNRRKRGRDRVRVENAIVSDDAKTVLLEIRDMQPSDMMEIVYRIKAADGTELSQRIQNTIHQLGGG